MKIAVLAPIAWRTPPRHYGPWEQMASNLAEGLAAAGIDVTLFATGDSITSGKLNAVIDRGYEEDREADAKVLESLHISNVMEQADQFDLIHNHYDFLPLTYSGLIRTPVITTIHGFSSEKIIPVYQKYNASGYYVSISNSDRHPALNYISTVYNGLRTDEFDPGTGQGGYLLFFGRIHPDKGTAEAIQIALNAKHRLIIAGIVQDVNYFREKVEPFLNDEITFIGAAGPEKRNQLLGGAAALLHPINFEEPFGLSVAEAMLCETPVIAFDRGAMRELINDHKTGFLVKNADEAVAAVEAINTIHRPECREWVMRNFSQKKMAEDYISLYHRILD
ncbi:glycosyltransferase family 4 protein [Pedobacter ginsengisoli]|uniref:glycosyltransferase family 4 protein n=1 Tax=Pedobacter ginsengisoli TaxID=363852 RepID=UPI002550D60F|nr:glycosyltransferase family 4 protein [Pedobacter ginsengisoli]